MQSIKDCVIGLWPSVLVVGACVTCAYCASTDDSNELTTVQSLQDLGATVYPADRPELIEGHPGNRPEARGAWCVQFDSRWRGRKTDFRLLKGLSKVYSLDLTGVKDVDDSLFASLRSAASLRELTLDRVEISEKILQRISRLGDLQLLRITGTQVSDRQLSQLSSLHQLKEIQVSELKVGDDGLTSILALPQLKTANIAASNVTDRALSTVCKGIRDLNLSQTAITDRTLDRLVDCPGLEVLSVYRTRVTGVGLLKLSSLKHLISINVADTDVSANDVLRFVRQSQSKGVRLIR